MKFSAFPLPGVLIIALLAGCVPGPAAPAPDSMPPAGVTSAPGPTAALLPSSMKGYELYAWQSDAEWSFTLITGTNRSKTLDEITAEGDVVTDDGWVKMTVHGVDALNALLSRLPAGESVFWNGAAGIESTPPEALRLSLPPQDILDEVREHSQNVGLELVVIPQAPTQRLRVANQGAVALHNLVVIFPDERIEFGDVPAGTTTDYRGAPQGVYRYAAYEVELDGEKYQQPVIDWVGEAPMPGQAFTYTLAADAAGWETEGQVIRLVEVSQDRPPDSAAPANGSVSLLPSPDGQWTAIFDRQADSLQLADSHRGRQEVFPAGSAISSVRWSPDSLRLAVALSSTRGEVQPPQATAAGEIWLVTLAGGRLREPRRIYTLEPSDEVGGPWITFGAWSPPSSQLLFWAGSRSASAWADGLVLWSLEIETGQATRLAETALVNLTYQSWAPDGSALVFTNGGYRSAQVGKWLSLYEVESGKIRTLLARSEFIPGALAWSPAGDLLAFAAVRDNQTGAEWADWMSWENPAVLARRIYLLDPQAGEYRRLNAAEAYQDAPRWSADGKALYYVQIVGDEAAILAADAQTGEARSVAGCAVPLPAEAGYYGQVDWQALYEACPETRRLVSPPLLPAGEESNISQPEPEQT